MIKQFCDISTTAFRLRMQLRFGRLSQAPLRILRLEWRTDHATVTGLRAPMTSGTKTCGRASVNERINCRH